jgi:peroxiredoxin
MALSVHSPAPYREAENKPNRAHVKAVADDYGIRAPVYIDHDRAFFEALGAVYHPTFYVVDRQGRIRAAAQGAQEAGGESAKRLEAAIQAALRES